MTHKQIILISAGLVGIAAFIYFKKRIDDKKAVQDLKKKELASSTTSAEAGTQVQGVKASSIGVGINQNTQANSIIVN